MGVKKVREYFETFGLADRIVEFDESSATAEMAAHAAVSYTHLSRLTEKLRQILCLRRIHPHTGEACPEADCSVLRGAPVLLLSLIHI